MDAVTSWQSLKWIAWSLTGLHGGCSGVYIPVFIKFWPWYLRKARDKGIETKDRTCLKRMWLNSLAEWLRLADTCKFVADYEMTVFNPICHTSPYSNQIMDNFTFIYDESLDPTSQASIVSSNDFVRIIRVVSCSILKFGPWTFPSDFYQFWEISDIFCREQIACTRRWSVFISQRRLWQYWKFSLALWSCWQQHLLSKVPNRL